MKTIDICKTCKFLLTILDDSRPECGIGNIHGCFAGFSPKGLVVYIGSIIKR